MSEPTQLNFDEALTTLLEGDQMTEVLEQPADQATELRKLAAEDQNVFDADAIRAEVDALDIGNVATTDDEKILYRFMRRRQQLMSEQQRIEDQMKAMVRDLENRVKGLDYVYLGQAESIVKKMIDGKKTKSIKTPFGTAGFRTQGIKLDVIDEAAIFRAIADGDLPIEAKRVKTEIAISELTKWMKEKGELPPGCETSGGEEKFFVK